MKKRKFSCCNLFRGARLDVEAKDLTEAATYAVALLFDRDKKFNIKELTMANNKPAIEITGTDIENGNHSVCIVAATEVVENTPEFKVLKKVN